jgi:hypothetical protein
MVLLYSAIGIVCGLAVVAVAVWVAFYPSLTNRESSLPEPGGNSHEPNDSTNIWGTGNDHP